MWKQRLGKVAVVSTTLAGASILALRFGQGGLWQAMSTGPTPVAQAAEKASAGPPAGDLEAVSKTLQKVRDQYVDPERVEPRAMFLNALDQIQRDVPQVIVEHEGASPAVRVRVGAEQQDFRVDNVDGPWDVLTRLREVFGFLRPRLSAPDVDMREVEYAAANGILRTLDPHSVFLSPEDFREMNMHTSGHFGGLGIVISIRDQMLTVMRPMPETPAGRANLRRLDRIVKINDESTLNMPLEDAVQRLRGPEGTPVTVWVERDGPEGWRGARAFEMKRERIKIRSVDAKRLADGVGYVRIKQFQQTTDQELEQALKSMEKEGALKGLVLDLRGNPGGLLDQAARVADRFLAAGPIVSTVGASEGRETQSARDDGVEPTYPIVLLTSPSSASASEIVAGALKAHERALVVGQRTFGKGSVQLVFPDVTSDGAALKLTIAQYLTPGDVSIQGIGVVPDVALDPMTVDPLEMDLFRSDEPLRERDLSKSLANGNPSRAPDEQPAFKLRYRLPQSERLAMRELGADVDDDFVEDFSVRFARRLVAAVPAGSRADALRAASGMLAETQRAELQSISGDLAKLGVDWAEAPAGRAEWPKRSDFAVTVATDKPTGVAHAGEPMELVVSVKNNGAVPAYQLRATTKSDSSYYNGREFAFGRVNPGETKTARVPLGWCEIEGRPRGSSKPLPPDARRTCALPLDAPTRADLISVRFDAADGEVPAETLVQATVEALPQPVFAYTYQLVDARPGNGDGRIAAGEGATLFLMVKNVGTGESRDTQANLRNLTGDGVVLRNGRFDLKGMKPGEERQVAFTFDVLDKLQKADDVKLELSIVDQALRVGSSEKLVFQVGALGVTAASGTAVSGGEAVAVRETPEAGARVVGSLPPGTPVRIVGKAGDFTSVVLGEGRTGFVASSALGAGGAAVTAAPAFQPLLSRSPPELEVKAESLVTRADSVVVTGEASDTDKVQDLFMFVGGKKVLYQSNRAGADARRMRFSQRVELQPGINLITVVARENADSATRRTIVVRRDGPNGELLPTPKGDSFGEDWDFDGNQGD